jgi:hypothetical protein
MGRFVVRKNQRFREPVPVQYLGKGIIGQGVVKDLSLSGGQIAGDIPIPIGTTLAIKISVPGEQEPLLIDPATVQWTKGKEFGVEFGELPRDIIDRVTRIITSLVHKQHGKSSANS